MFMASEGLCDMATPLRTHLKKLKKAYVNKDYDTVINEACNALYHDDSNSVTYSYLARSYEKTDENILAIIAYMKYMDCCSNKNRRAASKRIEKLKPRVDQKELLAILEKKPENVMIREGLYKGKLLNKTKDYIYNPMGLVIEEKCWNSMGKIDYRIEYLYDDDGVLKEKITYDPRDRVKGTVSYTYDEAGLKVLTETRNLKGRLTEKEVFTYDPNNHVKSIVTYNQNEDIIYKKTFMYNNDNLFEERSVNYVKPLSSDNYIARFKEVDGKISEKTIEFKIGLSEKIKYSYRINGKVEREMFYHDQSPIKAKKYAYTEGGDLSSISEYEIQKRKKHVLRSKIDFKYASL